MVEYEHQNPPYIIVNRAKDTLRRHDQVPHLPRRHLKVHLRPLEQPLEEARHAHLLLPASGSGSACSDTTADASKDIEVAVAVARSGKGTAFTRCRQRRRGDEGRGCMVWALAGLCLC